MLPEPGAEESKSHYFFCRLVLSRAIIAKSMTPAERQIINQHVAYWEAQAQAGRVLIMGSVKDERGAWGLLILSAQSRAEAENMLLMDPAISARSAIAYQIHPVPKLFDHC